MRMARIDGHSFSMTAFGTEDGVWFIADGISGEKIIEKYHISFLYDVEAYLKSLDRLKDLEGRLFIPSHGEVYTDMDAIVERNRNQVFGIADLLRDICKEETGTEEVIFSPKDRETVGKAAVEQANKAGGKKLKLSGETRAIQGGFILRAENVEVNCAFDTLVRLQKAETAGEVVM